MSESKPIDSNAALADAYLACVMQYATKLSKYIEMKQRIGDAPVDICDHFRRHGTLATLPKIGVGDPNKEILESILRHGVAFTQEAIATKEQAILQERFRQGPEQRSSDDDQAEMTRSNQWDDVTRSAEE